MKRFILPILLIALLLLVGCDQDMRNGLAGFLGTFGGNAYLDSGMIPPDHSNAAATVDHIVNLGGPENSGSVSEGKINGTPFGLAEELELGGIEDVTSFLLPQDEIEQNELKNNLEDALGSDSEKEALLNELSQPAEGAAKEAAEGTVALLGALLEKIFDSDGENDDLEFLKELFPDLDESTDLTQGDVLMLQLMIDLVGNAVDVINEVKEGEGEEVGPKDVIPLIDSVLFAAWVAGEIDETTSLDFSGFGNLSDFVSEMMDK